MLSYDELVAQVLEKVPEFRSALETLDYRAPYALMGHLFEFALRQADAANAGDDAATDVLGRIGLFVEALERSEDVDSEDLVHAGFMEHMWRADQDQRAALETSLGHSSRDALRSVELELSRPPRPLVAPEGPPRSLLSYRVFVSHSMATEDTHIVQSAISHAHLRGVECYLAERDPRYGESISAKVERAIQQSQCVVVLWTQGGASSQWVNQEVGFARAHRKPILPVVEKGVSTKGFVGSDIEYVELNRNDPVPAMGELSAYLAKLKSRREQDVLTAGAVILIAALFLVALSEGQTPRVA